MFPPSKPRHDYQEPYITELDLPELEAEELRARGNCQNCRCLVPHPLLSRLEMHSDPVLEDLHVGSPHHMLQFPEIRGNNSFYRFRRISKTSWIECWRSLTRWVLSQVRFVTSGCRDDSPKSYQALDWLTYTGLH